jgi:uncharacterized membrane protein YjfL (UPF0719 family)
MFDFNPFDIWTFQALAIDLAIIVILLVSLRYVKSLVADVSAIESIKNQDRKAFGIAFAGGIIALSIALTGAASGEFGHSLLDEAKNMAMYGITGLFLIKIGLIIQDKLIFTKIPIQKSIGEGNIAAAFMDFGSSIAVALLIRSSMLWVEGSGMMTLAAVVGVFIISQVLLSIASFYRKILFKKRNDGGDFQDAIYAGNSALALRYIAYLCGVAMVLTSATGFITFKAEDIVGSLVGWSVVAVILAVIYSLIVIVARKIILPKVDVAMQVDKQGNIEVAAIEAAIYIAFGFTFIALFS